MKGLFQCPPWAKSFCPFRACCQKLASALLPLLYPSACDFQFPSAGDRGFRATILRNILSLLNRKGAEMMPFSLFCCTFANRNKNKE